MTVIIIARQIYHLTERRHREEATAEQKKTFHESSSSSTLTSVSKLYDTIILSVATSQPGLLINGDSLYSPVFEGEQDMEEVGDFKGGYLTDTLQIGLYMSANCAIKQNRMKQHMIKKKKNHHCRQ